MKKTTRWQLTALALLIMGLSIWVLRIKNPTQHSTTDAPQIIIQNLVKTTFSSDGLLASVLSAKTLYSYKNHTSRLDLPKMKLYSPHQSTPWLISAHQGFVHQNQRISLIKHVVMSHPKTSAQHAAIIRTPYFLYNPHTKKGHTAARVSLDQAPNHTTGVGMRLDFESQILHLLAHVQSTFYAP